MVSGCPEGLFFPHPSRGPGNLGRTSCPAPSGGPASGLSDGQGSETQAWSPGPPAGTRGEGRTCSLWRGSLGRLGAMGSSRESSSLGIRTAKPQLLRQIREIAGTRIPRRRFQLYGGKSVEESAWQGCVKQDLAKKATRRELCLVQGLGHLGSRPLFASVDENGRCREGAGGLRRSHSSTGRR